MIRVRRGSRWRRLNPGRQALLVLAHLRNGDTYFRLAAGFAIGTTTAWRYVREAINLLAALADDLNACATRPARLAYAILDGTLIPIDRVADQPYYSGKHKRHGVTVQAVEGAVGQGNRGRVRQHSEASGWSIGFWSNAVLPGASSYVDPRPAPPSVTSPVTMKRARIWRGQSRQSLPFGGPGDGAFSEWLTLTPRECRSLPTVSTRVS
ncbi:Helix-turn-helix of DDE superfamily endonuclease [Micromonospora yangpuensis]|uniref:Helix-turn-helix of DDE superfamily endonuclease n=1 Tax=Micromonospora yangpuensis TaxID=683228 RepID=A0A1C6U945_9ACTN|nr:Helix-turn-helix of DDE superfamily endonuclease [Micromonospora yangpuensis]